MFRCFPVCIFDDIGYFAAPRSSKRTTPKYQFYHLVINIIEFGKTYFAVLTRGLFFRPSLYLFSA